MKKKNTSKRRLCAAARIVSALIACLMIMTALPVLAAEDDDDRIYNVKFYDIELYENICGVKSGDGFRYQYYPKFEVYYKDWSVLYDQNNHDYGDDMTLYPMFNDHQYEEPWAVGDHFVTMTVAGFTSTVKVTVKPDRKSVV